MHLESLTLKNYRKFREKDNTIYFVRPKAINTTPEDKTPKSAISPSTTLIIGKNNSGKTTVVNALKMLCQSEQPSASDFNLLYLNDLFEKYKNEFKKTNFNNFDNIETPSIEFILTIDIDFNDEDLMTNLAPFMSISEKDNGEPVRTQIVVNINISEEAEFKEKVKNILEDHESQTNKNDRLLFDKFYSLLSKENRKNEDNNNIFKITFSNQNRRVADKFSLKKLIKIKEIKANRHLKDGVLSDVFNKIVEFQFTHDTNSRHQLETSITSINHSISRDVESKSTDISQVLGKIENTDKVDLNLSGNVTYNSIMKGLIKYNFMDGEYYIPEDQFGLGYINLLNIIGEIIHFVDSYEERSHLSKINLLFIEEPEAFMHPQMQEFFIKRIDNAVMKALEIASNNSEDEKTLQCQIVITTHSSHIVNSKINSSNTFNNLNYLTTINKCAKAINLNDNAIVPDSGNKPNATLNFIKKHIKYKVSELFFSDAIIFVEGVTEETLLNYYIEKHKHLSDYYISVFNINGAHGKLYLPLAKKLSVPSLIITDLDIKRENCERNERHNTDDSPCNTCGYKVKGSANRRKPFFLQITDLTDRVTTNETLINFNQEFRGKSEDDAKKLDDIDLLHNDNLYIAFQNEPIKGQYATSLEEAIILTNHENDILNSVIKECKPRIYSKILIKDGQTSRENLIKNSYELQRKLSDSKSTFSNNLLFKILSAEDNEVIPELPNYIKNGMDWLVTQLQKSTTNESLRYEANTLIDTLPPKTQEEVEVEINDAE